MPIYGKNPKGEKEVGEALYCLHPPIFRIRGTGRPPIVIAKAVVVVASPERERISGLHGDKENLPSGINMMPAAIDFNPKKFQVMSSLDQEHLAQLSADGATVVTDSDSTTTSMSRKYDLNARRASTHPSTQKQEYLHGSSSTPTFSPSGVTGW